MSEERGKKLAELEQVTKELEQLVGELEKIGNELSEFGDALQTSPTTIYFSEGYPMGKTPRFSHNKLKEKMDTVKEKISKAQELERRKNNLESELGVKITR